MAFNKFARASVTKPSITVADWEATVRAKALSGGMLKNASRVIQKFDPSQYLLSHCTIVASVDTEEGGGPTGSQLVDGFQIDRRYSDYLVTPESSQFINNNHDCWERKLLLACFRTFVGAENYVEHLQIPELSKGKIVDAAARDIGDSVYVDILVATDRKHRPLVSAVKSGQLQTLSMGCQVTFTICTKCGNRAEDETQLCFPSGTKVLRPDGTYIPIEDVVVGDALVTHKGAYKPVLRVGARHVDEALRTLNVEGVPTTLRSTMDHPYWVLRPAVECACGCGRPLRRTVEHANGAWKAFRRRFLPGHNTRLRNPNAGVPSNVRDLSELFETRLEFVEARDLQVGDYLTFPIPRECTETPDGTPEKAKLIGYFLAEGSFIKRGGECVGVSFDFGSHEKRTLVEEVRELLSDVFGRSRCPQTDWRQLPSVAPVRRRATSRKVPSGVVCPSCNAPSEYALNARFKSGRDDCYVCKICGRNWIDGANHDITPRVYDNGSSCSVRLMDAQAADFFYRNCGEYASAKRLSQEAMMWPADIQRHILNGWLGGDGTQDVNGVRGNTSSFHLMCQMHLLAARCGMYARRSVTFGGKTVETQGVVNGDGSVTVRDYRGWLPSFSVTCPEPVGFSGELRFEDQETARVTMSPLTNGFKRVGDWLIYRVRSIGVESYSGLVHNVEVEGDHSYVVEGVAVHNCPHIRHMKGNTFLDGMGRSRKIAELCGHIQEEPGSVKFIEASWVANPAFTGAVLRNILTPEEAASLNLGSKVQVAFSQTPKTVTPGMMSRAANSLYRTPKAATPKKAQFDFGDDGDGGGEGAAPAEDKDPMDKAVDDMAEYIREKAIEKVRSEMSKNAPPRADLNEDLNETLIKEALQRSPHWRKLAKVVVSRTRNQAFAKRVMLGLLLYRQGGWKAVQASTKFSGTDILAISRFLDLFNRTPKIAGEARIYRTVVAVGGVSAYANEQSYLSACRRIIGREITGTEKDALMTKGRLYDLGR